jgi:integrase
MPQVKLTDRFVASIKTIKDREEYRDTLVACLALRVTRTGVKSYSAVPPSGGRETLGRYPSLTVAEARTRARKILEAAANGSHVAAKEAERRREQNTFHAVAALFIERYAKPKNRGWERQQRDLEREFVVHWRDRQIEAIRRRDILDVLDGIADRTSPQRANRYCALIKRFFGWCVDRGILDSSPTAGVKPPGAERSRDRVLSDEELVAFCRCGDAAGAVFGPLFRLLVLTAQRLGEVSAMRWEHVDLEKGIWTVPAENSKNGRANEVPLSQPALEILKQLPRGDGYVFPAANGSGRPASGFSKAKRKLERAITGALRPKAVAPWRLHDIRRSAASGMAQLGIEPHVIERVLNHVSGQLSGVAGVYNRYGYLPEKRHALETWAAHIDRLLNPRTANVVELTQAR